MYLTLDIGNTQTKYARWQGQNELQFQGVLADWEELKPLLVGVEGIAYCDVKLAAEPDWMGFRGQILKLNSQAKLPFKHVYKTPDTLGADRLAVVAGAISKYPSTDVLIVDAGTCIKFELLNHEGVYLGGSISPGLNMRYKALKHFTQRLPEIEHRPWDEILGASTEESILAGVQQGFFCEAEQRIAQFAGKFAGITVLLTGGDAPFLADRLKTRIFAEPLLIHEGLLHCLLTQ